MACLYAGACARDSDVGAGTTLVFAGDRAVTGE